VNSAELATVPLFRRSWIHILLLLILSSSIFINSVKNEFVWDDVSLIAENMTIRGTGSLGKVFTSHYWDLGGDNDRISGNYRPLTVASFMLNYQLAGSSPAGFRIVNIAIHSLNTCLVYVLALLLGVPSLYALAAGLIFAVHPAHVESVVWITGRCELMACTGLLSSLCFFLQFRKQRELKYYLLSLFMFIGAVLSKESAFALIPILLCYEIITLQPKQMKIGVLFRRLWRIVPFIVIAVVFLWLRYRIVGAIADQGSAPGFFFQGNTGQDIFVTMVKVFAYYWLLLGFPLKLSAHYDQTDFPVPASLLDSSFVLSLSLHLLLTVFIVFMYKREKSIIAFAAAWVYLALLPYSHIIHFEWLMAERFLYIPSVGFVIACVLLIPQKTGWAGVKSPVSILLLLCVLVFFGFRTAKRNCDWRNELSLFGALARAKPDLLGARIGYGNALLKAGKYEDALVEFKAADRLKSGGEK